MSERNKLTTDQLTALGQALSHLMFMAENGLGPVQQRHSRDAAGKLLWIAGIPEIKIEGYRTTFHAAPPTREIDGASLEGKLLITEERHR